MAITRSSLDRMPQPLDGLHQLGQLVRIFCRSRPVSRRSRMSRIAWPDPAQPTPDEAVLASGGFFEPE
jgi:hypothetical protein